MERVKHQAIFKNEYVSFKPSDWVNIEGVLRPVLYKVVTENMNSLGLRKNPNIMTFKISDWTSLSIDSINPGVSDWGGIWSALKLSGAKTLNKYMREQYGIKSRIFKAASLTPLYANSYRVKSVGVYLYEEINGV